ncbi:hypothetical protein LX36DRAFT_43234 [Colletotrichum falcatum]|nr:hypothetical protein LX36DRAFT_43234 [Colletotrichum falcatum]
MHYISNPEASCLSTLLMAPSTVLTHTRRLGGLTFVNALVLMRRLLSPHLNFVASASALGRRGGPCRSIGCITEGEVRQGITRVSLTKNSVPNT